ncbi:MAG: TetR/AcrR family transcriptional regulator [Bacilli bacterium]
MSEKDQTRGLKKHNEELNELIIDSLKQALIILMSFKPFEKISITELCQKAGVSRMGFYGSFKNKDELLTKIVMDINNRLLLKVGSPFRADCGLDWYVNLFTIVKEENQTLKLIFSAGFKYHYLSLINSLVLHDPTISDEMRYSRIIWAGGVVNTIIYWLDNNMNVSVENMGKFTQNAVSAWIK